MTLSDIGFDAFLLAFSRRLLRAGILIENSADEPATSQPLLENSGVFFLSRHLTVVLAVCTTYWIISIMF